MQFQKKFGQAKFFGAINDFRSLPVLVEPYSNIWRYASAVLVVVLAVVANLHVHILHTYPTLLLFAAVIFSTWYGGLGPGLTATVLAMMAFDYYFTAPIYSFSFNSVYIPQSIVFVSVAVLISSLVESQRQAEQAVAPW